jgi:sugar fermentation stimulation protein A
VSEAVTAGFFPHFAAYPGHRREVRYGVNSRIDILLEGEGLTPCHVEIKNVHLCRQPGLAEFPDSVTARGAKHLREMAEVVRAGGRAMMVYLIQMRADAFRLAGDIDPAYAAAFAAARHAGVEALAVSCDVSPGGVAPCAFVPILP